MKKIKTTEKVQKKAEPLAFKTKAMLIGGAGLLILVIIVLMIIESQRGKISIKNDTEDLKLEYVKAYFVDMEGPVNEKALFENLEPGKMITQKLEAVDLLGKEANLEIRFKFENYEELFVDAGYFDDDFRGNVKIDFEQIEDGLVRLKVKANNGLLSSNLVQCNETHDVYYKEGYIAE